MFLAKWSVFINPVTINVYNLLCQNANDTLKSHNLESSIKVSNIVSTRWVLSSLTAALQGHIMYHCTIVERCANLGNFAQIYLCTHLCSVHVMMLIPILLLLLPAGSVSLDNILSTLQNNSEIQSTTEYARGAAGLYPNLPCWDHRYFATRWSTIW